MHRIELNVLVDEDKLLAGEHLLRVLRRTSAKITKRTSYTTRLTDIVGATKEAKKAGSGTHQSSSLLGFVPMCWIAVQLSAAFLLATT